MRMIRSYWKKKHGEELTKEEIKYFLDMDFIRGNTWLSSISNADGNIFQGNDW